MEEFIQQIDPKCLATGGVIAALCILGWEGAKVIYRWIAGAKAPKVAEPPDGLPLRYICARIWMAFSIFLMANSMVCFYLVLYDPATYDYILPVVLFVATIVSQGAAALFQYGS